MSLDYQCREVEDQTDNYQPLPCPSEVEVNCKRVIIITQPIFNKFCNNRISTGKYSIVSFVPRFLFEQFRKYSNLFFLVVAVFQQIPGISPTGRFTTLVPLIFILFVSAVKELIEDYARHAADKTVNNSKTRALREYKWEEIFWKNVQVGDVVYLTANSAIPADIVIISTSEPMSKCYIETSNLDGETSLKLRQGIAATADLRYPTSPYAHLKIECEQPNRSLEEFVGTLYDSRNSDRSYPLDNKQILLRGATLKNTCWVVGAVVYAGKESKIMLNSSVAPLKRSSVDKQTNFYILVLVAILVFLSIFMVIANAIWTSTNVQQMWYFALAGISIKDTVLISITAFLIFHTIIPISLQVTLELVRFLQAFFINWDLDMYDAKSDTQAIARTSNLNEDLGQVKRIFSDKTGTLTQNVMEFKMCSIGSYSYGFAETAFLDRNLHEKISMGDPDVDWFFTILSVCHTVVPEYTSVDEDNVCYHATSPDERALVVAAKTLGYIFLERDHNTVKIRVREEECVFKVLQILEFTSARKRMSVVVEFSDGKLFLMTKGADNVICDRLSSESSLVEETLKHVNAFSKLGLRTLCVASRQLDRSFYENWALMHHAASVSITNRNTKLDRVYEAIEQDLTLLGATAIEDKLQDGVPETIVNMHMAGISIWILTGDNQETAINISLSSRLIYPNTDQLIINGIDMDSVDVQLSNCELRLDNDLKGECDAVLIVTGKALESLITPDLQSKFCELSLKVSSVICCRVSPGQKAEVVRMVKSYTDDITLAIGDGANDVGMIQAAHVGVGIFGVEGRQAACSSDYAIGQFSFLNKLLLVHGFWSFNRITKVIFYSFYKNICLFIVQFWFTMVSGFSGQIVFERWSMALYNVVFSAAPPFSLGLFERSVASEDCLKCPNVYKRAEKMCGFNKMKFMWWIINGIFHSAVLFWIPILAFNKDVVYPNAQTADLIVVGNTIYSCIVVTVCLKAGVEHASWTIFSFLAICGTIGFWFLFLVIYPHLYPSLPIGSEMVGMDRACLANPTFWLLIIVTPLIALTPDIVWKALSNTRFAYWWEDVIYYVSQGTTDTHGYFRNSRIFLQSQPQQRRSPPVIHA